jgi:hypothetical protein
MWEKFVPGRLGNSHGNWNAFFHARHACLDGNCSFRRLLPGNRSGAVYRRSAATFPVEQRQRAGEVFSAVGTTLQRWLMGRLMLMAINGVGTSLSL